MRGARELVRTTRWKVFLLVGAAALVAGLALLLGTSGGAGEFGPAKVGHSMTKAQGDVPATQASWSRMAAAVQAKAVDTAKANAEIAHVVVRRGDTLTGIAAQFDVPGGWSALYRTNAGVLAHPDHLAVGQVVALR